MAYAQRRNKSGGWLNNNTLGPVRDRGSLIRGLLTHSYIAILDFLWVRSACTPDEDLHDLLVAYTRGKFSEDSSMNVERLLDRAVVG